MTEHSPAPWEMREDGSPARIYDAAGETIARVYLTDQTTRRRDAAHRGNARVMIAAPVMLDALRCALDDMENSNPYGMPTSDELNPWFETVAKIRAAIANAEGRP